mmetsp:Transcript_43687/g.100831  ORF Transcript_43687/g.100831 Transcript_43687/m.100831 type:complete len:473 (-) Transcript_43687:38-1456(-)
MAGREVRESEYVPISRQDLSSSGRLVQSNGRGTDPFLTWNPPASQTSQVPPAAIQTSQVGAGPTWGSGSSWGKQKVPDTSKPGYPEASIPTPYQTPGVLWDAGADAVGATARSVVAAGEATMSGVDAIAEVVDSDFQRGASQMNPLQVILPENDLLTKLGYNPPVGPPKASMTTDEALNYRLVQKPAEAAWDVGNSFVYKPVAGIAEVVRGLAADTARISNDYIVHPIIEPIGFAAGGLLGGTAYGAYRVTIGCASGAYRYILSPLLRGGGYALEWTGDGLVEIGAGEKNYQGRYIETDDRYAPKYGSYGTAYGSACGSAYNAAGSSGRLADASPSDRRDFGQGKDFAVYPFNDDGKVQAESTAAQGGTLPQSNSSIQGYPTIPSSPSASMTIPTRSFNPPGSMRSPPATVQDDYVMVPKKEYEEYMHHPTSGSIPVRTLEAWPKIGSGPAQGSQQITTGPSAMSSSQRYYQ